MKAFKIINYLVLLFLFCVMSISMIEWFQLQRYDHLDIKSAGDCIGLLLGIGLSVSALWCCTYRNKTSIKSILLIHVGLFLIVVWFTTMLYPSQHPREIFTLDPNKIELQGSEGYLSQIIPYFVLFILLLISPIVKIREITAERKHTK